MACLQKCEKPLPEQMLTTMSDIIYDAKKCYMSCRWNAMRAIQFNSFICYKNYKYTNPSIRLFATKNPNTYQQI